MATESDRLTKYIAQVERQMGSITDPVELDSFWSSTKSFFPGLGLSSSQTGSLATAYQSRKKLMAREAS